MRVIVVKDKHEEYILEASTDEQWAEASLNLLTERWDTGYWYDEDDPLPFGSQDRWWDVARTVVEMKDVGWTPDGRMPRAWALLEARSKAGYEYEGVELKEAATI